jgi:hypothetical protein
LTQDLTARTHFFLRDVGDEGFPFFSPTVAETVHGRSVMQRWLGRSSMASGRHPVVLEIRELLRLRWWWQGFLLQAVNWLEKLRRVISTVAGGLTMAAQVWAVWGTGNTIYRGAIPPRHSLGELGSNLAPPNLKSK